MKYAVPIHKDELTDGGLYILDLDGHPFVAIVATLGANEFAITLSHLAGYEDIPSALFRNGISNES